MRAFLWWGDFLPADLLDLTQRTARDSQAQFQPSTVTTNEANFRESRVLFAFPELYARFAERLTSYLPDMHAELGDVVPLAPSHIEMQMTVHLDGHYFKRHTDNGNEASRHRRLTFVYYFQLAAQKPFTGGDLLLEVNGRAERIQPNHNTIVVFPAHCMHEVEPVHCASGDFADGRFTLNGWLHA